MQIDIVAVIPEILESPLNYSIIQRAIENNILNINVIDLKKYGKGKFNHIDDYQYGGGSGMVIQVEPIEKCISDLQSDKSYDEIIYLTPDGEPFNQQIANELSLKENLLLLCGRYKGIDERVRENIVTREISIGDYVIAGGEMAAAVIVEAVGRLLPGVLNDEESALLDSFQGELLSPPIYSRPADYKGWKVPDVLLSGHKKKIDEWRFEKSLERTRERRPDLLD